MMSTDRRRSLQAAKQDLDRQRASDSLKRNLEKRPARDELVERMSSLSPSTPFHFHYDCCSSEWC